MKKLAVLFILLFTSGMSAGTSQGPALSGDLPRGAPKLLAPPTEFFIATDKFPQNGKYTCEAPVYWAVGVAIRNFVLRDIAPPFTALPATGDSQIYAYSGRIDFEMTNDGGLNWVWVHTLSGNTTKVRHTKDSSSIRVFDTEILAMNISGGGLPVMMSFRESPTKPSHGRMNVRNATGGYIVSSFFDVFMEMSFDGGLSWAPALNLLSMKLWYPDEVHLYTDNFPPEGKYTSESGSMVRWAPGFLMRNIEERNMLPSAALPPPAGNQTYLYSDSLLFEVSFDGGLTWQAIRSPSTDGTKLTYAGDDGNARFFDGEILSLNVSGGGLPAGVLIRESPTLVSSGKYNIRQVATGYMVSSFFDVFLEISADGGSSWYTPDNYITLKLDFLCPTITLSDLQDGWMNEAYSETLSASGGTPPYQFYIMGGELPPGLTITSDGAISGTPTGYGIFRLTIEAVDSNGCTGSDDYALAILSHPYFMASDLFPPNGKYLSPEHTVLTWANGVMIRDATLRDLMHIEPLPPPLGITVYPFAGTFDFEISPDGGLTWSVVHAPGHNTVMATNDGTTTYPLEVLQMDIAGGGLPPGVLIRESPTKASPGRISVVSVLGGYMVSSFFDVWLEISMDGGASWSPSLSTFPMGLTYPAEYSFLTDLFPPVDGIYKSVPGEELVYPTGAVIRNIDHSRFSQGYTLPILGKTIICNFTGAIAFEISLDGGLTWSYVTSASSDAVQVRHWDDSGTGSFYDTEILTMDIAGGGLPGGMLIRESPTRASTGWYNVRPLMILGDRISSFFDVFLELSMDGGMTWQQAADYVTMELFSLQTIVTGYSDRWNMVSVPLLVNDFRKSSVFPTAASDAFTYDSGYVKKDTLSNGSGYWVKFNGVQDVTMMGVPVTEDTILVTAGWNMIGSISKPVPVSAITSVPPGIITGQFWGYSGLYAASDTINPGRAYWVKVLSSGGLILSNLAGPAGRIKIVPAVELPPPPPGEQSGDGKSARDIPSKFALEQNYPNPFNPVTMVRYQLPEDCRVTLKVYNTLGEEVAVLVNGMQTAGYRSVEFDAGNLASGVYIYRLSAGSFTEVRKMLVIR